MSGSRQTVGCDTAGQVSTAVVIADGAGRLISGRHAVPLGSEAGALTNAVANEAALAGVATSAGDVERITPWCASLIGQRHPGPEKQK